MSPLIPVTAAGLAACAVSAAGIFAVSRFEDLARRSSVYFVSFAAGVLVTVTVLHLVPLSFRLDDHAPDFVLAGLFFLYLIDRLAEGRERDRRQPITDGSVTAIIAIGLHSVLDGIIFSVTFSAGMKTGVLAAAGMVLHEFPEGIIVFSLLERAGYRRQPAMGSAFLVAGATTPAGALAAYPFIHVLDLPDLGPFLAVSGGALLYLGAAHLLPITLEDERNRTLLFLFAGAALAALAMLVKHG